MEQNVDSDTRVYSVRYGIRCTAEPSDLDASCLIGSFYKNARIKYDVAAQLILNVLEMRESSADYYGTTLVLGLHPYSVEAQRRHKEEKERGGEELGRYLEKDLVSAIAEILGLHNLNLTDDFQQTSQATILTDVEANAILGGKRYSDHKTVICCTGAHKRIEPFNFFGQLIPNLNMTYQAFFNAFILDNAITTSIASMSLSKLNQLPLSRQQIVLQKTAIRVKLVMTFGRMDRLGLCEEITEESEEVEEIPFDMRNNQIL